MHRSIFAAVGLLAGLTASAAAAHAHLLMSSPMAGATVAAPKAVTLHLSEALEPKFTGLELTKGGAAVPVKVDVPANDKKSIVAEPAAPLTAGDYKVSWHAVSADGHRTQGMFTFKVR